MTAVTINLNSVVQLTDDRFDRLCRDNPDLKFERDRTGNLIIMSPTGGESGKFNAQITADFVIWNRQTKLGQVFDSSTGYRLPQGGDRSPDVSWIKRERWNKLSSEEKVKFIPIAPDFVLELMSPTDRLAIVRAKMEEYLENRVRLGWLINTQNRQVEIYRLGKAVEILSSPLNLSGEDVLPGFILDLRLLWES